MNMQSSVHSVPITPVNVWITRPPVIPQDWRPRGLAAKSVLNGQDGFGPRD
jgi:hypothetical protein